MAKKIKVKGNEIRVILKNEQDYISLTDMLKTKDGDFFISDWLRNRNTVEFLGIWESIYNPGFNYGEFAIIKSQVGLNSYKLSVKEWVDKTHAIGLQATAGRYGGTYAHKDIAFEFGMWISAEFKIYLIKEFQRLKDEEAQTKSFEWKFQCTLAKVNYKIHTDAIKCRLIPSASDQVTGHHHLRYRGRFAERRSVRHYCRAVAPSQSKATGQHARCGNTGTIGCIIESGKHQRRADSSRIGILETLTAIE